MQLITHQASDDLPVARPTIAIWLLGGALKI